MPKFVELVPWSAETEVEMMASARVGIMPLPDELFERGKCGFKLVQYMGVGLPAVASPVGENLYIVRDGRTGYLADSSDHWYQRLTALLDDHELADRMAQSGHERYNTMYCTEIAAQDLNDVIVNAVDARRMRFRPSTEA